MTLTELCVDVGKRALEDEKKISLPGTLITPASKPDALVLVLCGLTGHHYNYVDHFGKHIGKDHCVYVSQLRSLGFSKTSTCISDFAQVDRKLRDIVETDNVIYVAHSMGAVISVAAKNRHNLAVKGIYCINTAPSIGDTMTRNPDIQIQSLRHRIFDMLSGINYGPFGVRLKDEEINEPVRFAIAGQDEIAGTCHYSTAERFVNWFEKYPNSSTKIFEGKNHCFNNKKYKFKPFNEDCPEPLVQDVKDFLRSVLDK